jgi:hypothetical protein
VPSDDHLGIEREDSLFRELGFEDEARFDHMLSTYEFVQNTR